MADIQYLNYGDLQIELLALLNNLANNVQSYVQSLPWSRKRKEKFMSAYQDIMSRGIIGANSNTGLWVININGPDIEYKDEKDKQMYGEAAYFIQLQMNSLPTKASIEETQNKDLPVFNNEYFTTNFGNHLSDKYFGGRPFDTQTDWNSLDPRGDNGRRGRAVRAKKLADALESYSASLEEGKYNFEGSPFKDLNDFKTRLNSAVAALKTESPDDDTDALNAIGLRASDWFNDGSGDIYGTDREGNSITYGQYYDAKSQLELELAERDEQARIANERNAAILNKGALFTVSGINGSDAKINPLEYEKFIAKVYGTGPTGYDKINQTIQGLIDKGQNLSLNEKKLLGNFLYYIRQNNPGYQDSGISDQEYEELMRYNSLRGKKKEDFIRFPWKTQIGLDVYLDNQGNLYYIKNDRTNSSGIIENPRLKFNRDKVNQYRRLFLQGKSNQSYLNTPDGGINNEWSKADIEEASAIVADIASILDPEPWSAAGLGLVGSGLRHAALLEQPEITAGDVGYQIWDYASSVIGAIPLLGDAAIATKTIKSVAKLGEKLLKYAGRAGATASIFMNAEGSYDAIKKAIAGESLTPGDWKALGRLFQGLAAHGRMNLSNAKAKRVLTVRGVELTNPNTGNRYTLFLRNWRAPRAKAVTGSVKVKTDKGKTEIHGIREEDVSALEGEFIKAGNNQLKKLEALKKNQGFIEAAKKQGIKASDITEVVTNTSWRNMSSGKHSWLRMPKWLGTTGDTFRMSPVRSNPDNFEQYVSSLPKWMLYSTRAYDKMLQNRGWYNNTANQSLITTTRGTKFIPEGESLSVIKELENAFNVPNYKLTRETKIPIRKFNLSGPAITKGKLINGSEYEVSFGKSNSGIDEMVLTINGENPIRIQGTNLSEMKLNLGKQLQEINNRIYSSLNVSFKKDDLKWKDFVKSIRDLKRKGFLYKKGGKVTDNSIENFLKQYK